MSKQINLRMNEYSLAKLEAIADREQRPIAAMAKILLDEAMQARENRYASLYADKRNLAENPHNHIVTMLDSPDGKENSNCR